MIEALITGERDPRVLAELAKGRLRVKHAALIEALTGRFDEHHAELADMLLQQIDGLTEQIERLDARVEQLLADIPAAQAPPGSASPDSEPAYLAAADRPVEITGIGRHSAQTIIAEVGLSMAVFPTAAHLTSWAKLSPCAVQSGAKTRAGKTGKGNPYLKSALGEAAAAAGRTNTFLGARYRRLTRRIGKIKALVAVARSILVIIWELLADPTKRYTDLGPEFLNSRVRPERHKQNHIRQLEALGYKVTLEPVAARLPAPPSGYFPIRQVIKNLNPILRGWGNYFRTGNAHTKFRQIDCYVVDRLRSLMVKKRGRNPRPGQVLQWEKDWFNGHGLHRLRGTTRYPKAAQPCPEDRR